MKKMPEHIRALLDEMDVLLEKHKAALLSDDLEAAHKYGDELHVFMERHGKTMNLSDEYMEEMRRIKAKADASRTEAKISEAKAKQTRLAYEKSKEEYHEILLKVPPEGKSRTSH